MTAAKSLSFLLFGSLALGQSVTGTIEGNVVDPSHLAVANAEVRLVQIETDFARTAQTDQAGHFFFGGVQPSEYRVDVIASGFKRLQRGGVFLSAAQTLSVGTLAMEVGTVNESVQ